MSDTPLFDQPVDCVLESLSWRTRKAFRLVWEQGDDGADLRVAVRLHLKHLQAALVHNEFLDLELAGKLAWRCERLLSWAEGAGLSEHQVVLARAAVRYFILDEDGESDADSILGLEDDAEVLEAVARELGCVEILGD